MGKRIIQQARGHGSSTYRVRKKAYRYKLGYIKDDIIKAKVVKLLNSPGHSAPLAKIIVENKNKKEIFYNPACQNMMEGQELSREKSPGNILQLKDIDTGTRVYNIEIKPRDGGKLIRSGGNSALVVKKVKNKVLLLLPSKKEVPFNEKCRATIGIIAGTGRGEKPVIKAGKKFHMMKARSKLWPRTSAVKMNAIDHPFGSGRGKRIKSKIAKRDAPPGRKVGLLRPRRTGQKKK